LWSFTAERLLLYKKSLNEVSLGLLDLAMRLKMTSQSGRFYSRKFFAWRRMVAALQSTVEAATMMAFVAHRQPARAASAKKRTAEGTGSFGGGRCTFVRRLVLFIKRMAS